MFRNSEKKLMDAFPPELMIVNWTEAILDTGLVLFALSKDRNATK